MIANNKILVDRRGSTPYLWRKCGTEYPSPNKCNFLKSITPGVFLGVTTPRTRPRIHQPYGIIQGILYLRYKLGVAGKGGREGAGCREAILIPKLDV